MTSGIYLDEEKKIVRPEWEDPKDASKYSYLPKATGELKPYFTMLDESSPKGTIHILGISFHVYAHTPQEGLGDFPHPVVPVFYLAENQMQAVLEKAKVTVITWDEPTENKKGEYVRVKKTATAAEYISMSPLPALPDNEEYGKTVEWKTVMNLRTTIQAEVMQEKDRQIEELQAKLAEIEGQAKKSEKEANKNNPKKRK